MSFDSRLRDELREAVDAHDPREEIALQHVKATLPAKWSEHETVAFEELASPRPHHARAQRIVGALAACALLAGAIALPLTLRNRSTRPAAHIPGQPVTTGYQSTATIRIGAAPSKHPTSTTEPLGIKLADPVELALAASTRNTAFHRSHLSSDEPGIGFDVTTDAARTLLSLTVVTPTARETMTLTHNWATAVADARRADASFKMRDAVRNVATRMTALHKELLRVDQELVKLAPFTYRSVLLYDRAHDDLGGAVAPPSVPETGSVKLLNLANERMQLLSILQPIAESEARNAIAAVQPSLIDVLVSQTPAVLITAPGNHSNISSTLIAIGLLFGGLVLVGSAFMLGRRSRRVTPP